MAALPLVLAAAGGAALRGWAENVLGDRERPSAAAAREAQAAQLAAREEALTALRCELRGAREDAAAAREAAETSAATLEEVQRLHAETSAKAAAAADRCAPNPTHARARTACVHACMHACRRARRVRGRPDAFPPDRARARRARAPPNSEKAACRPPDRPPACLRWCGRGRRCAPAPAWQRGRAQKSSQGVTRGGGCVGGGGRHAPAGRRAQQTFGLCTSKQATARNSSCAPAPARHGHAARRGREAGRRNQVKG